MPPSDREIEDSETDDSEIEVVSIPTPWSMSLVRIRPYERRDAGITQVVFRESVLELAALDYEDDQREVWAERGDMPIEEWHAQRSATHTVVAVMSYQVVGFCDVDDRGHINMLFVAPVANRIGIGSALLNEVEEHYRQTIAAQLDTNRRHGAPTTMTAYVSLTAQSVFERRGFVVKEHRRVVIDDVDFHNLLMVKQL